MILQLKIEDYRIKVDVVIGKKPLIAGDPDLKGFPHAQQLPGAYKKVWGIAGSQNKKITEIEHFDFLIDTYTVLVKNPASISAIKKIRQDLESIIK